MAMDEKSLGRKWLELAEYDLSVAEGLFGLSHHSYCVFMCHMSIEKALKGLFQERTGEHPPKTHSLFYFVKELDLVFPDTLFDFMGELNGVHILTRYPEDLSRMGKIYTHEKAKSYLAST